MILHDDIFEYLASAPVKQTDVVVTKQITDTYGYYDDTPSWSSSDYLMSVNIDCVGSFLGTTTKKATVKLLGIIDTASSDDIFQIKLGIYNNDPSVSGFNYISQGFFIVEDITYNYDSGYTIITMYDHMWKAQKTSYTNTDGSSGFTYPSTIEQLASQMASAVGVELMSGFSSLPNAWYTVQADPYVNISEANLQYVISEIAAATGTTARISDTTLVFSQYNVDDENLDSSVLKKLKLGKTYGPVTSVVLGRVPQNDNIVIANVSPESNIITSIDTATNLFTIVGNAMVDGNLVRIESTGDLPSPLLADTNYYVFTNGSANTFALSETYDDATNGLNLIDITTSGSGTITLQHIITQEVQINNNELVDDDRQTLLPEIYAKLVGIEWSGVDANTVGLGWHEVGDVINFTQGSTTAKSFISEIHLVLAGSISERLVSVVPDVATINYQTAGGIKKTIYDTEIKVDKQQNEITSIVSEQETFQGETNTNFTELYQNISDIILTIQKSGGGNIILNSVGFATEQATDASSVSYDKLTFWDYNNSYSISSNGSVLSYSSSESQNNGGVSGQVIEMSGSDVYIKQRVNVAANTSLGFGVRVKNAIGDGNATITLSNDNDSFTIIIDDANDYYWSEQKIENFVSSLPWLDIEIQVSSATRFMFTDLRLLYGNSLQAWVQSPAEILSTNVQFTKLGMKIFDNVHDTETQVTYNEFSTRRRADGVVLFEADDSGVVTNDLSIKGDTNYYDGDENQVIKQITIPKSSALAGIAFIKVS